MTEAKQRPEGHRREEGHLRASPSPPAPGRRGTSLRPTASTRTSTASRRKWTKSGTVRLGSHPDDYLLALYGERPAFLVADPNTAGVYDTVYVDLDDDYDFSDEKPVTKTSPASYRDMNGDGYLDVSGGLLYYISDGTSAAGTRAPGGMLAFGLSIRAASGQLLAWTGDYDPGHRGPRHADGVERRRSGRRSTAWRRASRISAALPVPSPAARPQERRHVSGRRHRRRAEGQAGAVRRHLLLVRVLDPVRLLPVDAQRRRRDDELVRRLLRRQRRLRRGEPGGRHLALGHADDAGLLDRERGAGLRHDGAAVAAQRDQGRRIDPVRRHRLGLDRQREPDRRRRRDGVVEPRAGSDRRSGRGRRRRRRLLRRRLDPQHGPRRPGRLGDLGRHEPLGSGGRRGDRAGLPGLPLDPSGRRLPANFWPGRRRS